MKRKFIVGKRVSELDFLNIVRSNRSTRMVRVKILPALFMFCLVYKMCSNIGISFLATLINLVLSIDIIYIDEDDK